MGVQTIYDPGQETSFPIFKIRYSEMTAFVNELVM